MPVGPIKTPSLAPYVMTPLRPGYCALAGETDSVDKMHARVEFDLQYLRNWSLGLDLKIIVRTVRVAFLSRGAY